ncbi:MAG: Gx transporter family protein [Oscillospiraceae bacterium]
MKSETRRVTEGAVLIALALALSYVERLFPLGLLIPLPGVKLGLANIVTVLTLYSLGPGTAFTVLVLRCLLGSFFGGGITGLAFSMTGGLLAMLVMFAASHLRILSIFGVSILGAAFHNVGQVMAAVVMMKSAAVLAYLPPLLLVGLCTGFLTGAITSASLGALDKNGLLAKIKKGRQLL